VRSSFPRARKSSASVVRMRSKTPSRSHFWNRSWHVWYGGYRRGMSAHGAPVRRTHSIPLRTSRGSRHGRPPRGVVAASSGPGTLSRIASHCASVRSMARRTNTPGDRWKGALNHGVISITYAAAGCRMRSSTTPPLSDRDERLHTPTASGTGERRSQTNDERLADSGQRDRCGELTAPTLYFG
jgi:hypothetical protein